jgi:ketosteroid isomerase-like protein
MPMMLYRSNSCRLQNMAHSSNFVIIQNLYRANETEDLEAFYKDLSPNIVWKESDGFPTPGQFRSRADIEENVFNVLRHEWDSFHFSLEHLIDGNDEHIVAVGTYRGTHRKTRRSFEARASHLWHLRNGKITKFEQFADTYMMQNAATTSSTSA